MSLEKKFVLWKKWLKQDIFFIGQILKNSVKKNRIFLFDTANHDNLGDHAIALAQIEFIKQELPEYAIIEVPGGNILRHTKLYKKCIRKSDIVTIAGGGFLGSLWPFEEQIVQKILSVFQQNKIIIFPQTFFIEKNDKDFMKEHEGYMNHKNLIICLRDMNSCKRLIKAAPFLKDKILYMPDMVCGLTFNIKTSSKHEKVGICFRKDKECILQNSDKKALKELLYEKRLESVEISTIENRMVSPKERKEVVNNKLQEFSDKKLVITDRLHAMIFSAITGTPCIALDNKSGKVKGVYQWISNQEYILFAEDIEEVKQYISKISLDVSYEYDRKFIDKYWKKLALIIRGNKKDE